MKDSEHGFFYNNTKLFDLGKKGDTGTYISGDTVIKWKDGELIPTI